MVESHRPDGQSGASVQMSLGNPLVPAVQVVSAAATPAQLAPGVVVL